MARPTTMTEWWKLVLDQRANGRVSLLAQLLGVSVRTIHRWQTENIAVPDLDRRKIMQQVVGPELLKHPKCPKYLKFKIVKKPNVIVAQTSAPGKPTGHEPSLADILRNA